MIDLESIWKAICREVGVDAGAVHGIFANASEARWAYGLDFGWGGVHYNPPEVLVVLPYSEGENGFYLDIEELKDTCYHELIHLLLRDEIEEEDVKKMSDIINCRQKGWRFWCAYLREKAIPLGLGPVPPEQMGLLAPQGIKGEQDNVFVCIRRNTP